MYMHQFTNTEKLTYHMNKISYSVKFSNATQYIHTYTSTYERLK